MEAARRREGERQRCVDCGLVDGQTRRVAGDLPGGWKWERVKIQRDHPRELVDNGPRDWTVPRCARCHAAKTTRERQARAARTRRAGMRMGSIGRWLGGGFLVGAAGWWVLAVDPDRLDEAAAAFVAQYAVPYLLVAAVVLGFAVRADRRKAKLRDLGDAIAREMHTDPTRIKIRPRRWKRGLPVSGSCRYSSLFDDSDGSPGRAKVEGLLARKIGTRLDVTWTPHRDRLAWTPAHAPTHPAPELEVAADAPTPPTREAVVDRLTDGLAAVLGARVEVEVTSWHAGNVPQSMRVAFPASARVHEDKVQDAVEDKVRTLLPGAWRAEWRTNDDEVLFTDRPDPLAPVVMPPPLPAHTDLAALPMGLRDDGQPWRVRLTETHVLVAAASGAGKGSVLWSLIHALGPAVADGTVRLWAVDLKGGMELGRGRGMFEHFATTPVQALTLLREAVGFMQARAARLAAGRSRLHVPRPDDPMLVLVIDEIAALTKYGVDRKARDDVNGALGLLLSQGRAAGVCLVAAIQDPRKDVLTLRDLFGTRIVLRVTEPSACDMVLGNGARAAGARADRIPVEHAGVGYMMVDGSPVPERFRAAWISDTTIDRLVATYRPVRALPSWETVGLDDLAEGDRIIVDEDGQQIEVTLDARPCENADDPDLVDVEYTPDGQAPRLVTVADDTLFRRTLPPVAKPVYTESR